MAPVVASHSVNESTGTSWPGDKPSGTVSGDLLLAIISGRHNTPIANAPAPTGWTKIDGTSESTAPSTGLAAFWRVTDSTDDAVSTYTFTPSTATTVAAQVTILRITGFAASPINTHAVRVVGSGSSHATNSITPTVDDCLLIGAWAASGSTSLGWTAPAEMAAIVDAIHANASLPHGYLIAEEDQATAASVSRTATLTASAGGVNILLAVAPSATGTTYNDSPTGTTTASGTRSEWHAHSATVAGNQASAGTRTEAHAHDATPSGIVTAAGSITESHSHDATVTGVVTASGTIDEQYGQIYNDEPSGTVTASGSLVESLEHDAEIVGTLALAGAVAEAHEHSLTATGTVIASGTIDESYERALGVLRRLEPLSHTAGRVEPLTHTAGRLEPMTRPASGRVEPLHGP